MILIENLVIKILELYLYFDLTYFLQEDFNLSLRKLIIFKYNLKSFRFINIPIDLPDHYPIFFILLMWKYLRQLKLWMA